MQTSVQVCYTMLLYNSCKHLVRTYVACIADCLHFSFDCICWISQSPSYAPSNAPTHKLPQSNLERTHAVILVFPTILFRHSKASFVVFKKCEINSKARSVPDQHTLVPSAKAFKSLHLVNPFDFSDIRHFRLVLFLGSDLKQIKNESYVRITKPSKKAAEKVL